MIKKLPKVSVFKVEVAKVHVFKVKVAKVDLDVFLMLVKSTRTEFQNMMLIG